MKKNIQFLLTLLLSFATSMQAETNKLTYPEIRNLLKEYCAECPQPSIEKNQQVLNALESFVENTKKGLFYRQSFDLLFEKLLYFTLAFTHEDESIQRLIDKQYKLAVLSLESLDNIIDVRHFDRKKKKLFTKLQQKYQPKQSIVSLYEDMFFKLSKQKKLTLEKKLQGQSFINYVRNNPQIHNKQVISEASKKLLKRIKFLKTTNSDKWMLKRYISYLYNIKDMTTSKEEKLFLAILVINQLESHQITINEIKELRKAVIMLRYTNNIKIPLEYLSKILWWCEVRSFNGKKDQLQFLNNQMLSTRKLDALKMLVELGEVEPIERWSKKLNFENSETMFNLAVKQAKLRQATIQKNINLAKLFEQEISQSLNEITQQKQQDNSQYQQHIHWLIVQIGTHRKDNQFKKMLENLVKDKLFYNKSLTKTMSSQEKKKLSNELESKFKISIDAQFILNSASD